MNLFCFTLEGSSDSLYEPAQTSHETKECSTEPGGPRGPGRPMVMTDSNKWGGSEPCIAMQEQHQNFHTSSLKKMKRRSHVPAASEETLDNENSKTVSWQTSQKKQDLVHIRNHQNKAETSKHARPSHSRHAEGRTKRQSTKKRETDQPAQGVNFEAWNPNREHFESLQQVSMLGLEEESGESQGTLRRIQKLVRVKKTGQNVTEEGKTTTNTDKSAHVTDPPSKEDSPVITCIGLAKKPEKKSLRENQHQQQPQVQQTATEREIILEDTDTPWSPGPYQQRWGSIDCSLAWDATYHTCQRPSIEQRLYNFNFTLPRGTDWDKYERLIYELELRQEQTQQSVCSVTHLDLSESERSASFGRFDISRHHAARDKPEENGANSSADGEVNEGDQNKAGGLGKRVKAISMTMRKRMGRKYAKALSEEMGEDVDKDLEHERETDTGSGLVKACRRSSNSLESLYSLNSGQSSSSGVTSGSDGSSNRDSLRLDEDLPYTGQFCGKAKVHTDFVPSPYDTESLKLKVGDVIDIISKPPMGIWTGMLNNRVGNFKFIYVDVLPEEVVPPQQLRTHRRSKRPRPKTLQELLERLNLEDLASSLMLNGYETVDDLKELKEQHLIELNVTDPEQRHRLLAASEALQENDNTPKTEADAEEEPRSPSADAKADLIDCPRDSGCYIASDCSDNSKEDSDNTRENQATAQP